MDTLEYLHISEKRLRHYLNITSSFIIVPKLFMQEIIWQYDFSFRSAISYLFESGDDV